MLRLGAGECRGRECRRTQAHYRLQFYSPPLRASVPSTHSSSYHPPVLHVALYQPSIPPNTGNIARQCVGMRARLHLIGPLGFSIDSHAVRRAGLDYWPHLDLRLHDGPDAFLFWLDQHARDRGRPDLPPIWLITKHARRRYHHAPFADEDVILLGNEIAGLPQPWLDRWRDRCLSIPMPGPVRSYNLANSAAIVMAHACLAAGMYDRWESQ